MSTTAAKSVALIWQGPEEFTDHFAEFDVASHQFAHGLVHLWIDEPDGEKLVTVDMDVDAAEQLGRDLIRHAQEQRARAAGISVS